MVSRQFLILKILILIFVAFIIFYINKDFSNKQKILLTEKKRYNDYILVLSNLYSKSKTETNISYQDVKAYFGNFISFLESSQIIKLNQVVSNNNKDSIIFKIKRDYFLNLMKYLYDNAFAFKVEQVSLVNVYDEDLELSLVISYLYSLPKDFQDYFNRKENLNVKFWKDELVELERKVKEDEQKKMEVENRLEQQAETYGSNQNIVYSKPEFNPDTFKYKGVVKISNNVFAIIDYKGEDIFVKVGHGYNLEGFNVVIKEANDIWLVFEVNGKIYTKKVEGM